MKYVFCQLAKSSLSSKWRDSVELLNANIEAGDIFSQNKLEVLFVFLKT